MRKTNNIKPEGLLFQTSLIKKFLTLSSNFKWAEILCFSFENEPSFQGLDDFAFHRPRVFIIIVVALQVVDLFG